MIKKLKELLAGRDATVVYLANESKGDGEVELSNENMRGMLIECLDLKEGATDQEIADAYQNAGEAEGDFANETELLKSLGLEKDAKVGDVITAAKEAVTKQGHAEVQLANERKATAERDVTSLVKTGKVTAANRDSAIETLCNSEDYDADLKKLANESGKRSLPFARQSKTSEMGDRKEEAEPGVKFEQFVNERMEKSKVSRDEAWRQIKKEHQSLYDLMQQPQEATA